MLNKAQLDRLDNIRKKLHAHPEISEKEYNTQKTIVNYLKKYSNATIKKVANTGVLAIYENKTSGPTVLIRGDIDALPITETNTFDHASTSLGVSHKCGHDGHTAILLGLATLFANQPIQKGKLILLFQPAEEIGTGAKSVLNDTFFKNEKVDFAFALHNLPGFQSHQIVVKNQEFTANVKSIILKMTGKTAHAAEPQNGVNPSMAISELFAFAKKMTRNDTKSNDFFLMTPVYSVLGDDSSYGISAGYGEVHFTIRSWSTTLMDENSDNIVNFMTKTCEKYNLVHQIEWTEVFHANFNDSKAVDFIRTATENNNLNLKESSLPFPWGEDFGLFTQKYKGAMFGLGAGTNSPALHNPDYDYPDEITPTGINMFSSIINQIL